MIRIGHLFPYELNLYGENGNIKALKHAFKLKKEQVEVVSINLGDHLDLDSYDLLYMGSGTKKNQELIKSFLIPYKEAFLKYIKEDKILLVTGNSLNVFSFLDLYQVKYYPDYLVSDILATTHLCPGNIYGFQNTEYLIENTNHLLFNMGSGYGNNLTQLEGFNQNNFYVTSIIGPILARNTNLTNYFVDLLLKNK